MALEFDVYQGYTLTVIANARKHDQVFDSIPFKAYLRTGARTSQRAHSRPDSFPMSRGAKLVVGWFNDTLADFLANHQTRWRSCIWMQTSTRRQPPSPQHVGPRLRPGSVIVFDEYLNYRG
jgi:hypothetical protein